MNNNISDEGVLFGIIKEILAYDADPDLPIGVESMDDCALIAIDKERSIAVSSDFVRGSGFTMFKLGLMGYYDIGYYLICANLSDLASVGAKPIGLTTVVRYGEMNDEDFRLVFQGMKAAADKYGARILGGDIGGYKADVFAATAIGMVNTRQALLRKNVRDGDVVCVSGILGRPISALLYFSQVKSGEFSLSELEEQRLIDSWKRPEARVELGRLLAEEGIGHACQDISDGFKATLEQISAASGKFFTIYEEKIPMDMATEKLAEFLGIEPVRLAMSASVDFELFFTIDRDDLASYRERFSTIGVDIVEVGEVNNAKRNIMISRNGKEKDIPGVKFDQRPIKEIIAEIIK